jgi:DNA-binding IclR family transcriptional regulator
MAQTEDGSALKTVDKAMRILHAFSHQRSELSIGDLSRELGIHKSVVSRLVGALRRGQLLDQDPVTRRVRVGVGAFRLGSIFASRQSVVQTVTPFLGMLVTRTEQSAHAMVIDGTLGLVVATVESPSALRVIMRVGEHRNLHATAGGKLLLAFSAPELLEAAAEDPGLVRLTPSTITDIGRLRDELVTIRETRISWNNGESHTGAGGSASPVLDDGGRIIAAISSVYPLNVAEESQREDIARNTLAIAEKVSAKFRSGMPGQVALR